MQILKKMLVMVILGAISLFVCMHVYAVTSKDVSKQFRTAKSLYFKGKAGEAHAALEDAEKMVADILTAGDAAEKNKVKRLTGQIQKLRKDIDKKLGKSPSSTSPSSTAGASDAGQKSSTEKGGSALPSHVLSDLKMVDRYLGSAQKSLNSGDARNARRSLDQATKKLEQTAARKKKHLPPEHPEYIALQNRIGKLDQAIADLEEGAANKDAAAAKATAEYQSESDKWVAVFIPYVSEKGKPGYDPDRYFVAGFTEDQNEMARRTRIFGLVAADRQAYGRSNLGDNATEELRRIVRDVDYAINTFKESTAMMADVKLKAAERQMNYITTWLQQESQKAGSDELPNSMSKLTFQNARRDLDGAARLLGEADSRIRKLETQYQAALVQDAKLARVRVEKTRMIGDKFSGPELEKLKAETNEVLHSAKPGINILRTTVVSTDWQEENVIEWTDTSRSVLRHRITHSVSTQAAGKLGQETTLYTIHIAKDRRTDGSWSPLRGHIMFADPILAENVAK